VGEVTFAGIDPRYYNTEVTIYRGEGDETLYFERVDFPDVVYLNQQAKLKAVVGEIAAMQQAGRPVLVGTTSIESSEQLHEMLDQAGIKHSVLNAKRHTEEALIIAQAGQPGTVTVATSMAGRGTDILLGGNPEGLAASYISERCFDLDGLNKIVKLVVSGRSSEARELVSGKNGAHLGPETLAWVEKTLQQFSVRSDLVEERGIVAAIVPEVLQAFSTVANLPDREEYAEAVRTTLTYIRRGHLRTARERASAMGLPPEQVDWIMKWIQDYYVYRRQPVQFLVSELFNRHYSARTALVRAALAGDVSEAKYIVTETPDLGEELIDGICRIRDDWAEKRAQIWKLGGLHILGTERYEARRIDDQFRGRSARQGDPGTSRFYLSLEDELMRRFGGETVANLMERFQLQDDVPLEAQVLTRTVESTQRRLEGYYFDMRKHLVEYDEVVSRQRELIYAERREILSGGHTGLREKISNYFETELDQLAGRYLADPKAWISGEVLRAIAGHSNAELGESSVNAPAVIRRLRGILPVLDPNDEKQGATPEAEALREMLEAIDDADILQQELDALADQVIEDQHHVRLFVRSVAMLMPLGPGTFKPYVWKQRNKWEKTKAAQVWEESKTNYETEQEGLGFQTVTLVNLYSDVTVGESANHFQTRMEGFLDALLDEAVSPELRHEVEQRANETVAEVFKCLRVLAVRDLSKGEHKAQLKQARVRLSEGIEDTMTALVQALPQEQVESMLMGYYDRVLECWEEHIARRTMRGLLGRFGIVSPDREEEQLLRGPARIEQELAQEVADFLIVQSKGVSLVTDEQWEALWQATKGAYRTDRFQEVAGGPLAQYEAAFAHWLADQVMTTWPAESISLADEDRELLEQRVIEFLVQARARLAGLELEEFFRWLVLSRLDSEWIQYLEAIDDLRRGIGLQAYGQKSPQLEFRRRAFDMFDQLREEVQQQIVRSFFIQLPSYHSFVQRQREQLRVREKWASSEYRMVTTGTGRSKLVRDVTIGRNDPCWCGSGKKYKNCHMRQDMEAQRGAIASTRPSRSPGRKRRRRG
jgi:preprotein translocase subunit SecA